ncbi:MAG: hypothetical protein H0W83_01225 [Planctomycetes bacterium]|nr:hypothetical protein [Planctomycetota bacterium]
MLPAHEAMPVGGFHAYSNRLSVMPGEELDLRISGAGPVEIAILKHGASSASGRTVGMLGTVQTSVHPIHPGSYVHIRDGLDALDGFTIELWFRTLTAGRASGLFGQRCCQLWLTEANAPVLSLETACGRADVSGTELPIKEWHHLVARVGRGAASMSIDGERCGVPGALAAPVLWTAGALRIGARENHAGEACGFFTGDVWAPAVYALELEDATIRDRFRDKRLEPESGCLSQWRFDAVDGMPGRDVCGQRHGRLINHPTRMIPGPGRIGDGDWSSYVPFSDPHFGHAIRFMPDQCSDARWPVACTWPVPADLPSGQYAAKLTNGAGESRMVHFIVRPRAPRSRIMCLSTTSTRVAYNFTSYGDSRVDCGAYLNHASYPILGHLIASRRPASGTSNGDDWLATTVDFELPFYHWLEREGIDVDLYSEWDLEADPGLLDHYDVLAWAGHSEYWTSNQYQGLQRFVERGGHILAMSGNTAFWRVSVDPVDGVMECRKHERKQVPGTNCDPMLDCAHWHQIDHLPGTNMRFAGWPEWGLLGSVSSGYTDPPLKGPRRPYEVVAPGHAIFHGPRRIETSGAFAPDAAGYETDMTCRTMMARSGPLRAPGHPPWDARVPTVPDETSDEGLTILARARIPDSHLMDLDNALTLNGGDMLAEMTIRERPGSGDVFTAGSVLSSHALLTDRNFSHFIRNVLDRFLRTDRQPSMRTSGKTATAE